MTINKEPILKINGLTVEYEPSSLKYRKGKPKRNYFPTTLGTVNQTDDSKEAYGYVAFDLRSIDVNEKLFNRWGDLGDGNAITINTGNLNKNYSSMSVMDPNKEIPKGPDSVFTVEFGGNPAIE